MSEVQSKEQMITVITNDFSAKWSAAKDTAGRDAALKNYIKALRAVDANSAIAKAFEELAKQGQTTLKMGVDAMITIAQQQATKHQGLEEEREKMIMQLRSSGAKARSSMAGLFTTIAVIARAFGAEEFATKLETLAQAELDKVKDEVSVRTNIRNGVDEMSGALGNAGQTIRTSTIVTDAARAAIDQQASTGQAAVVGALNAGRSPQREADRRITWSLFYQNMKDAGVQPATLKQVEAIFKTTAATSGDKETLDSLEADKLMRRIGSQNIATKPEQDKIKAWLDANVSRAPA